MRNHIKTTSHIQKVIYFLKKKLSIQSKNRLLRRNQSHRPFANAPFKARSRLCMNLPTEIDTRGNRTWDLKRSKLQDPKPTTRPTLDGLEGHILEHDSIRNKNCLVYDKYRWFNIINENICTPKLVLMTICMNQYGQKLVLSPINHC